MQYYVYGVNDKAVISRKYVPLTHFAAVTRQSCDFPHRHVNYEICDAMRPSFHFKQIDDIFITVTPTLLLRNNYIYAGERK